MLFYGTITPYRAKVLTDMVNRLGNLVIVYNVHGQALDNLIANAKVVLNLRTTDNFKGDQKHCRISYLLTNGKCVLSQPTEEDFYGDLMAYGVHDRLNLMHTAHHLVSTGAWRSYAEKAAEGYKKLCEDKYVQDR